MLGASSLEPWTRQPLDKLIKERSLSYPAVAYAIGLDPKNRSDVASLRHVGYGMIYPSAQMLEQLPKYFDLPLEDLFDERVLKGSDHHIGLARRTGASR